MRERFLAGVARQLGQPQGLRGRLVGRALNRSNLAMVSAAVDRTHLRPGDAAADLGFGGGVGLRLLLDRVGGTGHVHGIDISTTMVRAARRRHRAEIGQGRLTVQVGSMADLPLQEGSLDAVVTVNTAYFVEDLPQALAEAARILRPEGRLVIGVGDPTAMAALPFTRHGFRVRPVAELVEALGQAGLTAVEHERVGEGDGSAHLLVGSRAG